MFKSINSNNKNISQKVIDQIQKLIMSGELRSGDQLPPERQLCEMLSIGRPALREALRALEIIGLVETKHGLGRYITNNIDSSLYKPLSLSFKLNNGDYKEILEFRYCLESFTIEKCAKIATLNDIKKLRTIANNMKNAETVTKKAQIDMKLHYEIALIAGNSLICNTFNSAHFLLEIFFKDQALALYYDKEGLNKIYNEHDALIKAIERRDIKKAMEVCDLHLGIINIQALQQKN